MLDILAFVLTLLVLPVLINKSTEGRFDSIKPFLRHIWTVIFAFFSLYLLQKPVAMEIAMKLHTRLPGHWGYIVAAICGALLLCGYWWFTGIAFNNPAKTSAPFSVEIVRWSGGLPVERGGYGFWIGQEEQRGKVISHADLAVFIQVVNLQPFVSQISSYNIEVKINDSWLETVKMNPFTGPVFFVPPDRDYRNAEQIKLDTLFDRVVFERTVQPHEPLRGWVLLQYKSGENFSNAPEQFRISLKDAAGTSFETSALKSIGKERNEDAQFAVIIPKGGKATDLSRYDIVRWADINPATLQSPPPTKRDP
jgi:hypothetical protein